MTRYHNPYVRRFLIASSLAFGLGSSAIAQSDERPGPMPSHGMGMHRMLRQLDLSDAQRDQVLKIFHDQAPAMRERMKAARSAREDLAKLRAESMARVREVLTPEQRAKLDQMREHRR
jgi:Spy/CpxP family protein refolding chaperone